MKATVSIEVMRAAITAAMQDAHGHIPIAAKALGVSRRTLARWLVQLPDVPRAPRGHHIAVTREDYKRALGDEASTFEDQCLSIGRELLPPCAITVLDGGKATDAYWRWLIKQAETP